MSIDNISINARFKYKDLEKIKKELIENLSKYLNIDNEIIDNLDDCFDIKNDYLELSIHNCFGNHYSVLKYIQEELVKKYKDIILEFFCIQEYFSQLTGQKITYNKKMLEYTNIRLSFYNEDYVYECPNCNQEEYKEEIREERKYLICSNCGTEFKEDKREKTEEMIENFYNKIDYNLIK